MKILILISEDNWLNKKIDNFLNLLKNKKITSTKIYDYKKIKKSDILFVLGYHKIIPENYLKVCKVNVLVHESNLPKGKGWSPIAWEILNNKNTIYFTLLKVNKVPDSGPIYLQKKIKLLGNETYNEIRQIQYNETKKLCLRFISNYPKILKHSYKQKGKSTFYKKRTYIDGKISTKKNISQIINLLRVSDYTRYPVFFEYKKRKFKIKIEPYE